MSVWQVLENGDFAAGGTPGWTADAGTVTRVAGSPNLLRWTATDSTSMRLEGPFLPCTEGMKIQTGLDAKQVAVAGTWQWSTGWYDETQTLISYATAVSMGTLTTSFTRNSSPVLTVPAGAHYRRISLRRPSTGAATGQAIDITAITAGVSIAPDNPDVSAFVAYTTPPSFVINLLDDTPMMVMPFIEEYVTLAEESAVFNFFTNTGICGPSRAAFHLGTPPQVNGVTRNDDAAGIMFTTGQEWETFWSYLRGFGYRTGLFGKYTNGAAVEGEGSYPAEHIPGGLDWAWVNGDTAEQQFDYDAFWYQDGTGVVENYVGDDPDNYGEAITLTRMIEFIDDCVANYPTKGFVAFANPRVTHANQSAVDDPEEPTGMLFPAAPWDRGDTPNRPASWGAASWPAGQGDFGSGRVRSDIPNPNFTGVEEWAPAWGTTPINPMGWMKDDELTSGQLNNAVQGNLEQIQQAQTFNDLLIAERECLQGHGLWDDVHLIVTSDNGLRWGFHNLDLGKGTLFDHDIRLPFLWRPPGGLAGPLTFDADVIVQNIDLLPTMFDYAGLDRPAHVYGRSLKPLIEDDVPAQWRRVASIQFRTPGSDWNSQLGSGQPGGYFAIRGVTTFGNYQAANVPVTERGEYYDNPNDPGQIVNLYPQITATDRQALFEHMEAIYEAADADAYWTAVTTPMPEVTTGDSPLGRRSVWVNGELITTPAYDIVLGGSLMGWSPKVGTDIALPGFDGEVVQGGKPYGPKDMDVVMYATDLNIDGTDPLPAARQVIVRDHRDYLKRVFDADNVIGSTSLVPMVYEYEDGQQRQADFQVLEGVSFVEYPNGSLCRFVIPCRVPSGCVHAVEDVEEVVDYDFAEDGIVRFESTRGATFPTQDFTLTFDGKFPGPIDLECGVSGAYKVTYTGPDLEPNDRLVFRSGARRARFYDYSVDPTYETSTDVSHLIKRVRGGGPGVSGPWLKLVPALGGGVYRLKVELTGAPSTGATVTYSGPINYASF